jgi:hypothetical protein
MRLRRAVSARFRHPDFSHTAHRHRCVPAAVRPHLIIRFSQDGHLFFWAIMDVHPMIEAGIREKPKSCLGFSKSPPTRNAT